MPVQHTGKARIQRTEKTVKLGTQTYFRKYYRKSTIDLALEIALYAP
jgi:hypothetical protein